MANTSKLRKAEARRFYIYTSPYIAGFLMFLAIPMFVSLYLVFTNTTMIKLGDFVGFGNIIRLLTDDALAWHALWITTKYSAISVPLGIVFALLIAVVLNQKLKAIGFFRTCFFIPYVTSGVAVTMLWGWIFNSQFGLLNYVLSVIGITGPDWFTDEKWTLPAFIFMSLWSTGNFIIILLAALQDIPESLTESAKIDGADGFKTLISVSLPAISPAVYFCVVLGVIGSFQIFMPMFLLTNGGPNTATYTFMLHFYNITFRHFDMSYGATLAWVLFAVIMSVTGIINFTSKYWVNYDK
jgi:multiple sugar transport system permease protein